MRRGKERKGGKSEGEGKSKGGRRESSKGFKICGCNPDRIYMSNFKTQPLFETILSV